MLVAVGNVVPDEGAGPYELDKYHCNTSGFYRGYKTAAIFGEWYDRNMAKMQECSLQVPDQCVVSAVGMVSTVLHCHSNATT